MCHRIVLEELGTLSLNRKCLWQFREVSPYFFVKANWWFVSNFELPKEPSRSATDPRVLSHPWINLRKADSCPQFRNSADGTVQPKSSGKTAHNQCRHAHGGYDYLLFLFFDPWLCERGCPIIFTYYKEGKQNEHQSNNHIYKNEVNYSQSFLNHMDH